MKRRTLLQGAVAAPFVPAKFAIAQPASARTLVFVPQANLTLLDPIFTTAQPTVHHGWAIYDLLFAVTSKLEIRPQMAEGYTLPDDGVQVHDQVAQRSDGSITVNRCGPRIVLRAW